MPARHQQRVAGPSTSTPACAACKYQRRRCTADCRLARYFPHDRPRLFRNAHRLFGVSNILKTLDRVGPHRSNDAMRAIAVEADAWDTYPAHGCVAVIAALLHQLRQHEAQLHQLNALLDAYRRGGIVAEATPPSSSLLAPPPPPMENNSNIVYQPRLYNNNDDDIAASLLWTMQLQCDSNVVVDMADGIAQEQGHRHFLLDTTQLSIQHDYDDISPFLENIDNNKEMPFESSSSADSSEKKAMKSSEMEKGANGLKDAAACFTLIGDVNQ